MLDAQSHVMGFEALALIAAGACGQLAKVCLSLAAGCTLQVLVCPGALLFMKSLPAHELLLRSEAWQGNC